MKSQNIEDIYPLSALQQGLLLHARTAPGTALYFVQWLCQLQGQLDHALFQHSWQTIIDRHSSLRTIFLWDKLPEPVQVVRKQAMLPWRELDWRNINSEEQQARLQEFIREDQQQEFDFQRAPLMRITLIRLADEHYQFVWSFHHLLVDGWSILLLLQEVFAVYRSLSLQQNPQLPPTRPFRDYIAWLRQQELAPVEAFWRERLANFDTPTPIPSDRPIISNHQAAKYTDYEVEVPSAITAKLQQFSRDYQITLNTITQAAWALLLHRHSGQDDIVFGATVAGRPPQLHGVENMVGLMINTLPVRIGIDREASILPWLKQIQNDQIAARQFEHSPLVQVQRWAHIPAGQQLFQSLLSFENYPGGSFALDTGLDTLRISEPNSLERVNYPLNISVTQHNSMSIKFMYDAQVFEFATIKQLAQRLLLLLAEIPAVPSRKVSDLPILTSAEREQLAAWNNTGFPVADTLLQSLFEHYADTQPDATALVFGNQQLSYGELEQRANQVAHHLQQLGVGTGSLVGLSTERSFEMLIGLLGVLKAGGAFVPLDPSYPRDRLSFMASDAGLNILLTQQHLLSTWANTASFEQVLCLDSDWATITQQPSSRPVCPASSNDLAYVIYTSGSTGTPKGVLLEHTGIGNLVQAQIEHLGIDSSDHVLQFAAFSFDASVFEIVMALCTGATLHLAKREQILPGPGLVELLREQRISVLTIVPSALAVVPYTELPDLRRIIVAGEACPAELVARWQPGRRFFNAYGPTEATVWSTIAECVPDGQVPHIGKPIINTQIFILDQWMRQTPLGVAGEVYIGGIGLARGYHNRPELSDERFVPNPFYDPNNPASSPRLYRAGDLARFRADGSIDFLGRVDHQVKIRGFRIELGEIENTLRAHSAVSEAAVIAREDTPGDTRLVAYIVSVNNHNQGDLHEILRLHVRDHLPNYMVPSAFVTLDVLPLMANGKLDRKALPAPTHASSEMVNPLLLPQSSSEQIIAKVWREVLQLPRINRHDNFFDIGGHSLQMAQIHTALQSHFPQPIALIDLFTYPTVSSLAKFITQQEVEAPKPVSASGQTQAQSGRQRLSQLRNRRERS